LHVDFGPSLQQGLAHGSVAIHGRGMKRREVVDPCRLWVRSYGLGKQVVDGLQLTRSGREVQSSQFLRLVLQADDNRAIIFDKPDEARDIAPRGRLEHRASEVRRHPVILRPA
jgi:hypothetical protein